LRGSPSLVKGARLRFFEKYDNEDERPRPLGVRGFKSHPPHSYHGLGSLPNNAASYNENKAYVVMPDIHQYPKRLEQALTRVEKSPNLSEMDKELIDKFSKVLKTQYISIGSVAKYVNHLKTSAETISKITKSDRGLANATEDDINEFSVWLKNESGYSAQHETRLHYDLQKVLPVVEGTTGRICQVEAEAQIPRRS
jgi:hypothetical protein